MKADRENGKCEKNTKGNLYFQLKVHPHLFHPRKEQNIFRVPGMCAMSLPGKKGAMEAWETASAPEEEGIPCHFVGTSWMG